MKLKLLLSTTAGYMGLLGLGFIFALDFHLGVAGEHISQNKLEINPQEYIEMRKLKYFIACTVDRFIARSDDSYDFFLTEGEHVADLHAAFPETIPAFFREKLGITSENQCFDAVVMGRKTYEVGLKEGISNPYPQMKQYVVSQTLRDPDPDIELVSSNPVALVRELKQQPGKDIWLCGGSSLATVLFPEIDEMILKVYPILLGSGIPLFSGIVPQTSLELTDNKRYSNGFILLNYRLKH